MQAVRNFFDNDGFTLCDSPIFTPAACEGTTTLFEVDYFDGEKGLSHSIRTALQRSDRCGVRQGLLFWSDVSRGKIQDTPSPDRVLDGRARDGVRNSRRRSGSVGEVSFVHRGRVLEDRQEELKILERDTSKLEGIVPPFPRVHYDDAVKMLHEGFAKGAVETKFEWGGDFGAPG